MACNRETSADGTTAPVCQSPDKLVPCCNNNCHSLGCAATMNLCSKCYSEHVLKEGGVYLNKPSDAFLNKPSDAEVDSPAVRLNADGADEANNSCAGTDNNSTQRTEDVSALGVSMVDTTPADASGLREPKVKSSLRTNTMNRSAGVSDLQAVFRSGEMSSSVGDLSASASDLRQQRIPSPLSLSSGSTQVFSPVLRKAESKLSLPPLPRQQAVNRCLACRKRVGLLGFKCRCGDIFCALHRYSDKHDCAFDYKAAGRAAIAKENPVVIASKIEKI